MGIQKTYEVISKNIFLFNFVPVIIFHIILLPVWLLSNLIPSLWMVTVLSQIVTTLLLPYLLIELNERYNLMNGRKEFISSWLLVSVSTLISFIMSYINWGLASGSLLNPDSETILIIKWETIISIIFIFVLSVIKQIKFLQS